IYTASLHDALPISRKYGKREDQPETRHHLLRSTNGSLVRSIALPAGRYAPALSTLSRTRVYSRAGRYSAGPADVVLTTLLSSADILISETDCIAFRDRWLWIGRGRR